jgi:hypothetical protein
MPERDLQGTFRVLKGLLAHYAPRLHASEDSETLYMLECGYVPEMKRSMAFAGVQIRRSFVSFHLLPIYSHPELLSGISDALRKRLAGRTSFNFVRPERDLLVELSALADRGFHLYEELGWIA